MSNENYSRLSKGLRICWEESLDSLMVIQSKDSEGKKESQTRLIYLVSLDEPYQYIRPVVQTYSSRGWSAGKTVSLKRLKDHLVDGMWISAENRYPGNRKAADLKKRDEHQV